MLRFVLSLVSQDNDYQRAQAAAGEEMALHLGVNVKVMFCDGDAIKQSQQLLTVIQSRTPTSHINGIVVQPAGTGMRQVAAAAAAEGIGWAVLHKEVDYTAELLKRHSVPVFMVSSDHGEEGRIQAKQLALLLPQGGLVMCVMGPRANSIAERRFEGLNQAKPTNIKILTVSGKWTEQSGYDAISSWLRLSTSQQQPVRAIVSQNDAMALGVKKALTDVSSGEFQERLMSLPVIGCDGLPCSGQAWVQKGLLQATVVVPVLAGIGLEILVQAMKTGRPPKELTVVSPTSYPSLADLGKSK